jgi:hypothetical protein
MRRRIHMRLEQIKSGNRYSSVSVVTRGDKMNAQEPWFNFQKGQGNFLLYLRVQTGCGTHPSSCLVGVVGSECVELGCHYTVFVSGMVLRNATESVLRVNSLSAMRETPPPPQPHCEGPKHSSLCTYQPCH